LPNVSWATHLGLDITTLEKERPNDWFQQHLATLHYQRAETFAEYSRLKADDRTFAAEIILWEKYVDLTRAVCDFTGDALPVGIVSRDEERRRNVEEAVARNTCTRCGFVWKKSERRFVNGFCSSCMALKGRPLQPRRSTCQPWTGRFASDDITPVDNHGAPYLPGPRLCRNADCVNPKHIRKERNTNG
jgi:hypothetical protein